MKREFPILEFDSDKNAVIEPEKNVAEIDIPLNAVICFLVMLLND